MIKTLFEFSDLTSNDEIEIPPNINFESLLGQLCLNRVAGIAYHNLNRISTKTLPKEFTKTLKCIYNSNKEQNIFFFKKLRHISEILKNADFSYSLLKGSLLNTKFYPDGTRTSNDVDILIQDENLEDLQDILKNNGFIQGHFSEDGQPVAASRRDIIYSRMNFGETVPFVKIHNNFKIEVDINFSLDYKAGDKLQIKKILSHSKTIRVDDFSFNILEPVYFLLHLCCHLYKEATTYEWVKSRRDLLLYKFSDINIFLSKHTSVGFYNELFDAICSMNLIEPCYYTFVNTMQIFPKLQNLQHLQALLQKIKPENDHFLKQITHPEQKKIYRHSMGFVEWFACANRTCNLIECEE